MTHKYVDDGKIMKCIYDTLNEHNIEIPFPQREITIETASPAEGNQYSRIGTECERISTEHLTSSIKQFTPNIGGFNTKH